MKRIACILFLALTFVRICPAQTYRAAGYEWSQPIRLMVENPGDFLREDEIVVLKTADLGVQASTGMSLVDPKAQPDDNGETGGNDIPCQIDGDEFAFAIGLAPRERKEIFLFKPHAPNAPAKDYSAKSDLTFDTNAGKIGNGLIEVAFPTPGSNRTDTAISYKGEKTVGDVWLYITALGNERFRTRGPVTQVEAVCDGPVRKRVRLHRQPDEEKMRGAYDFQVAIDVTAKSPSVLVQMDTIPRQQEALHAQLYASVWKADPKKDLLYFFHLDGRLISAVPQTREAYGRMSFEVSPPWLMLFDKERNRGVAVGAPRDDVNDCTFCIDLKRYELLRPPALANPREPLIYCTAFDFGDAPDKIATIQRARHLPIKVSIGDRRCEMVNRLVTSRHIEDDPMPPADVSKAAPKEELTPGIVESADSVRVSTKDMTLAIDRKTGAVTDIRCGGSARRLPSPGGFRFVRWPDRKAIPAAGRTDNWKIGGDSASFSWQGESVHRADLLKVKDGYVEWTVEIENKGNETQLTETRFSLPLNAMPEGWCFWDGSFAYRLGDGRPRRGFTTLSPGGRTCQGIFPSAAVWDRDMGVAVGLRPMDIHSFYGATADPGAGPDQAFNSILRLVIPPGEKRQAAFIIYGIDPNWGWRSCLDRYYALFPDVFAAPTRDDIWGLYSSTGSERVDGIGDKYIDICRRYRVGGMELYAPFTKTGEFYPDAEPCHARIHGKDKTLVTLNRDQMKKVFEVCNIATCTLSYVIPTKCNRALALEKYQDSIIKEKDGKFFLRDYWCVIGNAPHADGEERLAGMFAWGDRFGERLKNDIRRIIDNCKPEGFYFDNGAFVWEDYGRQLPFSSFDDDGQVYTNGGIPYALIQDDIRAYSPATHRNPGEFIQYFSGFRGQSHLTNCTSTQTNYIRSHRFIMGNKPIFVAHPRNYQTRSDMHKALLVGGLPWLTRTSSDGGDRMDLVRGFADVCILLARAGWRPVTGAVCDRDRVRIERCGDGLGAFFVIANENEADVPITLTANSRMIGANGALVFGDFFERIALKNHVDPASGLTKLRLTLPVREAVVLRASAMVGEAKSPFAMSSRLNGQGMEYAIESQAAQRVRVTLRLPLKMHFADDQSELALDVSGSKTRAVALAPDVRYHPDAAAVAKSDLLAKAEPTRVVIPKDHSTEEMCDARRIKGFHEFQAELLKKEQTPLTIVADSVDDLKGAILIGLASHPEIQKGLRDSEIRFDAKNDRGLVAVIHDGDALLITSATDRGLRESLWDYLSRIEAPLPKDDLKTEPLAMPKAADGQ